MAENCARQLFELAGIPQVEFTGVGAVVAVLLGPGALDYGDIGDIFELGERPWRIAVRRDLQDVELTVAISMGLATWWLATHAHGAMAVTAESLALCIALPLEALREAAHRLAGDVDDIAAEFVVSREAVVHRIRALGRPTMRSGTHYRLTGSV